MLKLVTPGDKTRKNTPPPANSSMIEEWVQPEMAMRLKEFFMLIERLTMAEPVDTDQPVCRAEERL